MLFTSMMRAYASLNTPNMGGAVFAVHISYLLNPGQPFRNWAPMYCISKRLSALVSHSFSFTTILLAMIFILSHVNKQEIPECDIRISSYVLDNSHTRYIYFSPKVDLSPQFHLNVKQIFVYLKMEYEATNSDMLWSTIVKRCADKKLHEYYYNNYAIPIVKPGRVYLELRGCIFPYIGKTSDVLYSRQELTIK